MSEGDAEKKNLWAQAAYRIGVVFNTLSWALGISPPVLATIAGVLSLGAFAAGVYGIVTLRYQSNDYKAVESQALPFGSLPPEASRRASELNDPGIMQEEGRSDIDSMSYVDRSGLDDYGSGGNSTRNPPPTHTRQRPPSNYGKNKIAAGQGQAPDNGRIVGDARRIKRRPDTGSKQPILKEIGFPTSKGSGTEASLPAAPAAAPQRGAQREPLQPNKRGAVSNTKEKFESTLSGQLPEIPDTGEGRRVADVASGDAPADPERLDQIGDVPADPNRLDQTKPFKKTGETQRTAGVDEAQEIRLEPGKAHNFSDGKGVHTPEETAGTAGAEPSKIGF